MPLWGLTGGIASGKSTVHSMLAKLGAELIDADAIYHQLIAPIDGVPSPLAQRIENRFAGVLNDDGAIDRRALGAQIFADPTQRRTLDGITHPAVAATVGEEIRALKARGVQNIFYNVPLLYERKLDRGMNGVIVVWVPRAVQIARLMQRDRLARTQAEQRLAAQMPLDEKRDKATWVIDNSEDIATTQRQVDELWAELHAPSG